MIRITARGPLFSGATRQAFHTEIERAHREAARVVIDRSNRAVNRDRGIYAAGWQPTRIVFGPGSKVTATIENTAPHAAVLEDGRRPGSRMAPIAEFVGWSIRRGITPRVDTESGRRSMAFAMARSQAVHGTPARRIVVGSIEESEAELNFIYRDAASRFARRIGG